MIVSKIILREKPRMTLYTNQEILSKINPLERIDEGVKMQELIRDGYYDKDLIIFIYSTSNESGKRNLVEVYYSWYLLENAIPDLIKTIELSGNKFLVSHPNIEPADNMIELTNWLLRLVQFRLSEGVEYKSIVEEVRKFYDMFVIIKKEDNDDK